jgi:hypothetical protein
VDERKWWVYNSVEPTEDWPGTEFFGPYEREEARLAAAMLDDWTYSSEEQIRRTLKTCNVKVDQVIWNFVEGRE